MAQYLLHPKHPLRTALYIILAVGLVVGGFITLKASQTSTEGRSKAAEKLSPKTTWDFAFGSEDWHTNPGPKNPDMDVENRDLRVHGRDGSVDPSLYISGIEEILGTGNKSIEISMKIKPASGHKIANCCKSKITYTVRTGKKEGKSSTSDLQFNATDDNKMHVYRTRIPQIAGIEVNQIEFEFKGFKKGDLATVDYIRLLEEK